MKKCLGCWNQHLLAHQLLAVSIFLCFSTFLPNFFPFLPQNKEKYVKKTKIKFNQSCEEPVLQVQKYNKGLLTSARAGVKTGLAVCFAQLVLQKKFTTIGKFLAS